MHGTGVYQDMTKSRIPRKHPSPVTDRNLVLSDAQLTRVTGGSNTPLPPQSVWVAYTDDGH